MDHDIGYRGWNKSLKRLGEWLRRNETNESILGLGLLTKWRCSYRVISLKVWINIEHKYLEDYKWKFIFKFRNLNKDDTGTKWRKKRVKISKKRIKEIQEKREKKTKLGAIEVENSIGMVYTMAVLPSKGERQ